MSINDTPLRSQPTTYLNDFASGGRHHAAAQTIESVRRGALQEAATVAGANMPDNEPGEYARGRLEARDAILRLLS